jgi:tRNA U55 pseudouridine synthase TruB
MYRDRQWNKAFALYGSNIKAYIATVGLEMFTDTDDITGNVEKALKR